MSGPDDVRRWSEELARNPASLSFIPLGEALRQQRQHELATRVVLRGLERHPHHPDAHDLLARLYVDAGDLTRAFDEWGFVLRYQPKHSGALKGLGFVCFNEGRLDEAERYLASALDADPHDPSIGSGLAYVRGALGRPQNGKHPADAAPPTAPDAPDAPDAPAPGVMPWERRPAGAPEYQPEPEVATAPSASGGRADVGGVPRPVTLAPGVERSQAARRLFSDMVGGDEQTALLLDANGFVLAGEYLDADGRDVSQEVGVQLSGVSDEAARAMRHLDLGAWHALLVETSGATVAMAPAPAGGLALIAAAKSAPIGLVRRFLERVGERAREAMGGGA
ncbi:MAG: tetratricopeptide repeat protein [Gemmatimonadaceae bacterium]